MHLALHYRILVVFVLCVGILLFELVKEKIANGNVFLLYVLDFCNCHLTQLFTLIQMLSNVIQKNLPAVDCYLLNTSGVFISLLCMRWGKFKRDCRAIDYKVNDYLPLGKSLQPQRVIPG